MTFNQKWWEKESPRFECQPDCFKCCAKPGIVYFDKKSIENASNITKLNPAHFRKEFLKVEYQEWQNIINVNAGSVFLFCREVGKYMVSQKSGSIINIISIIGTLGLPELSIYGASKGAVLSLTKSLALEWSKFEVRVNAIAPGFCQTSYTESFKKNKQLYDFTLERIPMKKWGMPIDVSNTCLYLASNMSSYVTGEVISVDGGWSAW